MPPPTLRSFLKKGHRRQGGVIPLMLRWLDRPTMAGPVAIFERKFTGLIMRPGGKSKAGEWFLSGDMNFANLSAERFALD